MQLLYDFLKDLGKIQVGDLKADYHLKMTSINDRTERVLEYYSYNPSAAPSVKLFKEDEETRLANVKRQIQEAETDLGVSFVPAAVAGCNVITQIIRNQFRTFPAVKYSAEGAIFTAELNLCSFGLVFSYSKAVSEKEAVKKMIEQMQADGFTFDTSERGCWLFSPTTENMQKLKALLEELVHARGIEFDVKGNRIWLIRFCVLPDQLVTLHLEEPKEKEYGKTVTADEKKEIEKLVDEACHSIALISSLPSMKDTILSCLQGSIFRIEQLLNCTALTIYKTVAAKHRKQREINFEIRRQELFLQNKTLTQAQDRPLMERIYKSVYQGFATNVAPMELKNLEISTYNSIFGTLRLNSFEYCTKKPEQFPFDCVFDPHSDCCMLKMHEKNLDDIMAAVRAVLPSAELMGVDNIYRDGKVLIDEIRFSVDNPLDFKDILNRF